MTYFIFFFLFSVQEFVKLYVHSTQITAKRKHTFNLWLKVVQINFNSFLIKDFSLFHFLSLEIIFEACYE